MRNTENFRFYYWCVAVFLILIARLIIWMKVYPVLRKHNIKYRIGGTGDLRAMAEYKRICIAERQPLTAWYILVSSLWLLLVLVVGWFVLIWGAALRILNRSY